MALTGKLGTSDSKAGNFKLAAIVATGPTTVVRWGVVSVARTGAGAKATALGVMFQSPSTTRSVVTRATSGSARWGGLASLRTTDLKGGVATARWPATGTLRDTAPKGGVASARWSSVGITLDTPRKGGVVLVAFLPVVSTEYVTKLTPLVFPGLVVWRVTTTRSATASVRLGVAPTARDEAIHQAVQSAAWSGASNDRDTAAKSAITQPAWRSGGTLRGTGSKSVLSSARLGALTLVVLVAQKRGAAALLLPALGAARIVAVGQIGGARGSVFIGETGTATLGLGESVLESAGTGESPASVLIIGESK
jgi:hypothetical protein